MSGMKNGRYQTVNEAIADTKAYINICIKNGDLAHAIHAAQDLATPMHRGAEWHGGVPSARHIWEDVFPTQATINQASENTREVFRAYKGGRQAVLP